jgi:hypothetical protein
MRDAHAIIKVQLPMPNLTGPALMYDEQRLHQTARPLTAREAGMQRDAPRAFYAAQWDSETGWFLLCRVADQGW